MLDMGKCKTKFPKFDQWYATLNAEQRHRVDAVLVVEMQELEKSNPHLYPGMRFTCNVFL